MNEMVEIYSQFSMKPEHVYDILAGIEERDKKLVFNFYFFFYKPHGGEKSNYLQ